MMKKLFMMGLMALLTVSLFAGVAFAGKYKPGTYEGFAVGYNKKKHPGKIEVEVTITGGKISKIDYVTFHQTLKGKQGEKTLKAKEQVPAQIIEKQGLAVDNVAKASLTVDGIKLAVARALEQAR